MKALKKIGSLLLVVLLVATMVTTALAAETKTITINEDDGVQHTYEAYQIFAGDMSNGVLSNVVWGSGVNAPEDGKIGGKTAAEWAEALDGKAYDAELAQQFAAAVAGYLSTPAGTSSEETSPYTIEVEDNGYYLVKDQDDSLEDAESAAYTRYILEVVGADVEATAKSDVPSLDKIVEDKNDSEGGEGTWGETADHDIGDIVNYELIGTLPSNYESYKTYTYKFTDEMSAGLTYQADSLTVYAELPDGTRLVIDPKYYNAELGANNTLTVDFENLKNVLVTGTDTVPVSSQMKIVVAYSCELNQNAVIGAEGNPNTAGLEFSNNPNDEGNGTPSTGHTPEDTVIVFTFELDVTKVDQDGANLTGAEFTLEKWIADESEEGGHWETVDVIKAENGYQFTSKGLDDGKYRLTESKTPDGYNTIAPIEFTVVAYHVDETEELTRIEIRNANDEVIGVWTALDNGFNVLDDASFTVTQGAKTIDTTVVNNQGSHLPSTGGIGTTIFYIVGGLLVVGTGVLLIVKRRMHNEG